MRIRMRRIISILFFVLIFTPSPAAADGLPAAFDLRNINGHSYIGAVRNQGDCGGCYAFGALAAAESTYNRAMGLTDDEAVDFSESFIIWTLSQYYDGLHGCGGASIDYEELTGILNYGVVTESVYPYSETDPSGDDHLDSASSLFSEWYRIAPNDIETMKRVLYNFGALDAAVEVDYAFENYSGGIYSNSTRSVEDILPYTAYTNHAISLVGWDDTGGYWILRNSWGQNWGEDGYMYIDWTSANVALEAAYLILGDWPGANVSYVNAANVTAVPYTAGGIVNANAVDIWTGTNSSVTNSGTLTATATSVDDMTAARGIYLWGGPDVSFSNSGTVTATAQSTNSQAQAYGVSMQGGGGENTGTITATASSDNAQALAYGILAFNGGSPISISNSGTISAEAEGDDGWAYGIWADSRSSVSIINSGTISANNQNANANIGLMVSGNGVNYIENTGTIEVSDWAMEWAIGIACSGLTQIYNTGTIDAGDDMFGISIAADEDSTVWLTLGTGSDLTGYVLLEGDDDTLELTGTGSEDSYFSGVENLLMNGTVWTLSGGFSSELENISLAENSTLSLILSGWFSSADAFESIALSQNSTLTVDADIEITESGTLSGNGTLVLDNAGTALTLTNKGIVSPGNSIGTVTIAGNYTHTSSSTLYVEAGNGASDKLIVTGTADIQGGSFVLVADGYLTSGSYQFLTAGTLAAGSAFDTVTTPAVFGASVSTVGANLSLSVTRNSYESLAATANQASLGTALDSSWPVATGDMADILNTIDNMAQLSSVRKAFEDLGPGFHSAVTTAAVDNALTRTDRIRQHLYESRSGYRSHVKGGYVSQGNLAASDNNRAPWQFWAAGTLLDRRYDSTQESPAVRDRLDGMVFGLDRPVGAGLTLGAAGAVSRCDIHDRTAASAGRVDSFNSYAYGALNFEGFHAQAVAGLGRNQYEADRAVTFLNRTAASEHRGWQVSGLISGGYDWTPGDWTIGPVASLQYLHLEEQGFMEEGADAADIRLGSVGSQAWVSSVGFRAERPVRLDEKYLIIPGIRAEWIHALSTDTGTLDASFPSTGQGFSASPRDQQENTFELDLSLTAVISPRIRAQFRYLHQAQGGGGYTADQAGAEVKVLF